MCVCVRVRVCARACVCVFQVGQSEEDEGYLLSRGLLTPPARPPCLALLLLTVTFAPGRLAHAETRVRGIRERLILGG